MEITEKEMKRVYLITLKGRLDAETSPQLDTVFDSAMERGNFRFLLDLEELVFISSRGLKTLLRVRKEVRKFNRGDLRLLNVPENISEALNLTGLLPLFTVYEDPIDAVGDF
jgi:anti-anti-sigma factor